MDDGATATRNRAPLRFEAGRQPRARWSRQPRHRRRRSAALLVLVALAVGVILGVAGGGRAPRSEHRAPAGFLGQVRTLAGSGPRSFAGRQLAAQDAAIDRTLAYTPYVRVAGAQHRELAITFDDGPGPYTGAVLDVLDREHAPATFFEVGAMEGYFHAYTTEIAARRDAIGDHTFSHAPMARLTPRQQRSQLLQDAAALTRYGSPFPRLFRPPYGLWNDATLKLLRAERMLMVLWTVDTGDWRRPGVRAIVRAALSGARPGEIILLHDAGGNRSQTVAALPRIIAGLRARGFRLVTVPQLLLDNPPPGQQQVAGLVGRGG